MSSTQRRPTVADVARAAAVSPVTVSRVLEGSDKVAVRTRDKVYEAMRAIGYYGNAQASQLVSGRAGAVGVITSNTADYGYARTISGIEEAARAAHMTTLVSVVESDSPESAAATVASVAAYPLAGVIVVDFDAAAHATIPLMPDYLPVVSASSPSSGAASGRPYVAFDDYLGAKQAVEHLIDLGHRSVFVMAQPNNDPPEHRSMGAQAALVEALLPQYPVVRCAGWQPECGYRAATEILDTYGDRVSAIACPDDGLAVGAMRAVHDRGLSVPEDVSITGFDDEPISALLTPSLTTLHQDFTELGRRAFGLLLAEPAEGEQPERLALNPELVIRESTAPPNPARGLLAA